MFEKSMKFILKTLHVFVLGQPKSSLIGLTTSRLSGVPSGPTTSNLSSQVASSSAASSLNCEFLLIFSN